MPQEKLEQLRKLLDDPDVRRLLEDHAAMQPTAKPSGSAWSIASWLDQFQAHLNKIYDGLPRIPSELADAMAASGLDAPARVLLYFLLALVSGLVAELAFAYLTRHLHRHQPTTAASEHHALRIVGRVLFSKMSPLLVFSLIAILASMLFGLPPSLGQFLTATLLALVGIRVIARLADVILLPNTGSALPEQKRLVPISDAAARFWFRRTVVVSLIVLLGWAAAGATTATGLTTATRGILVDAFETVLLAVGIEIVWRRPRGLHRHHWHGIVEWLLTLWLLALWVATVSGLRLASLLILYVVMLPATLKFTSSVIQAAFQHPDSDQPARSPVLQVLVERAVRAGIIALGVLTPAMVLQIDASEITGDAETGKIVRGVLSGIVVLLFADMIWEVAKALINHRLARSASTEGSAEDLAHSDRLLTLLPILRNFLAVLIAVVAILMALSAIGIAVGPLIAGAGIFGVAIGFGSQTLVKDVISGIFYMFDDAFRVGEYIQSGTYKGTVESFSLRSVRLRHHRGPIFTVPFGSLGAVENMSRDWVIDKFLISVSYETDVAAVKKLLKGIGAEILEDPELGPLIIETVKMKGVEQFGDYGINLSFSMTTKPGQQSMVRRRALVMIREAFAANGIAFASPTVQLAKGGRTDAAISP